MNYDNFRFYFFLALGLGLGLGLATTKVTGLMFGLLAVVCSLSLFISMFFLTKMKLQSLYGWLQSIWDKLRGY